MGGTVLIKPRYTDSYSRHFVAAVIALTALFTINWVLNDSVFPFLDPVYFWTRELSAIGSGAVLAAIAFISYWKNTIFSTRRMMTLVIVFCVAGAATMSFGLIQRNEYLLIAGTALATIAVGFAEILIGVGCIGLELSALGLIIPTAYTIAFILRSGLVALPPTINLSIFFVLPVLAAAAIQHFACPVLKEAQEAPSPAAQALVSPSSILPFSSQVFITLLLFRFFCGFTFRFGEIDSTPLMAFGALAPFAILLVIIVATSTLSPDLLFKVTIICIAGGLLLVWLSMTANGAITQPVKDGASVALSSGTGFFEILMYYLLVAFSSRNTSCAIPVMAWGATMSSWGTLLGANFGKLANRADLSPFLAATSVAIVLFGVICYIVFVQQKLNFSAIIEGITPPMPTRSVDTLSGETISLQERCEELGRMHGLTEREQEVLEYLARGRDVPFIQEELVVSYNTVKTHVSHIYAKLGVHSRQELIDFVEQGG